MNKCKVLGPFAVMSNTDYRFSVEKGFKVKQGYYSIPYPKIIKRDGLYYSENGSKLFGRKIDNTSMEFFCGESNVILFKTKDFLVDYKTTGWIWFDLKIKETENNMELTKEDFIGLVSHAHIEGQSDAGIAASWSNARAYAEGRWDKLNPDLTDRDVVLRIAMDYIGATEAREVKKDYSEDYSVYLTSATPGPGEINPPLIVLKKFSHDKSYNSFCVGRANSSWKEGKPFESKYEYEEVYFKDIIKGVKE